MESSTLLWAWASLFGITVCMFNDFKYHWESLLLLFLLSLPSPSSFLLPTLLHIHAMYTRVHDEAEIMVDIRREGVPEVWISFVIDNERGAACRFFFFFCRVLMYRRIHHCNNHQIWLVIEHGVQLPSALDTAKALSEVTGFPSCG